MLVNKSIGRLNRIYRSVLKQRQVSLVNRSVSCVNSTCRFAHQQRQVRPTTGQLAVSTALAALLINRCR